MSVKRIKIKPNNKKISIADIETSKEAEYHFEISKLKIISRVFYIYKTIAASFDMGRVSWDMEKYEINDFDISDIEESNLDPDCYCSFDIELPDDKLCGVSNKCRALIKNKKGLEVEHNFYDGSFPGRWIFQDFEDELKDGIKKYQDRLKKELEEERLEKDKIRKIKENRRNIIARVKKKLSPEELEVVFGGQSYV